MKTISKVAALLCLAACGCKARVDSVSSAKDDQAGNGASITLNAIPSYPPAYGRWTSECMASTVATDPYHYMYVETFTEDGFLYRTSSTYTDAACKALGATRHSKWRLTFSTVATPDPGVQQLAKSFVVAEIQLLELLRLQPASAASPMQSREVDCHEKMDYARALGFAMHEGTKCFLMTPNDVQRAMQVNVSPFGLTVDGERMLRDHLDVRAPETRAGCSPNLKKTDYQSWLAANLQQTATLKASGQRLPGTDGWCNIWTRVR